MTPAMAAPAANNAAAPSLQEIIGHKLDLAIWVTLATWPALTLAVQNAWGGPETVQKRDWFAGAVSELLAETPDADAAYVEEILLQVMQDEFEVCVDDGSPAEVAERILERRARVLKGDFVEVDALLEGWRERQRRGEPKMAAQFGGEQGSEDEEEWDPDWDDDVKMDEAPSLVPATKPPRAAPEVDEEGFTKVVGRRK